MTALVSCALAWWFYALPVGPHQSSIPLRFHHFHFISAAPSEEMNALARRYQAPRVLLQGLGVGVRLPPGYALFDRGNESGGRSARDAYVIAARWLSAHGAVPSPDALNTVTFDSARATLDHVAFSAADLAGAVEAIGRAGASPFRTTSDSAFFRTADGAIVEIVRDTDRPDAFWCPMHPDMRSTASGKCAICGMPLVAIPPLRIGEYQLDVLASPLKPTARGGVSSLRLTVREPVTGAAVTSFAEVHERLFHLFIIGRDLEYFAHVHPERSGNSFILRERIPPGSYMLFADFTPTAGTSQMVQRSLVTPGFTGRLFPELTAPGSGRREPQAITVNGVQVSLSQSTIAARKYSALTFTVRDTAGRDLTDIEPFLGAAGHLFIVKRDLSEGFHVHPEEQEVRGAVFTFLPLLPAGDYKMWVQFQRGGKVITAPFDLRVE